MLKVPGMGDGCKRSEFWVSPAAASVVNEALCFHIFKLRQTVIQIVIVKTDVVLMFMLWRH
jgi:hypothetical protein